MTAALLSFHTEIMSVMVEMVPREEEIYRRGKGGRDLERVVKNSRIGEIKELIQQHM